MTFVLGMLTGVALTIGAVAIICTLQERKATHWQWLQERRSQIRREIT